MERILLTKNIFGEAYIRPANYMGTFGPNSFGLRGLTDKAIAEKILKPGGTARLAELAKNRQKALIVTDDNTRRTPLKRILPHVFAELEAGGITAENTTILIGLGTHRPMTVEEIKEKFGKEITNKYNIVNHDWSNPSQLVSYGKCDLGFEVTVNKLVKSHELLISVGTIVPHATAGFSGGGKTIMPGISGEKTIEDTHWAALDYPMSDILGRADNKVREAIVSICRRIGLDFIVNTILFNGDRVYGLVAGDVEIAHREGIGISKGIYGAAVPEKADIVIAEAYPTDIDLRQAIKGICSADIICRDRGVIILLADCPEGIAPQFPAFRQYGFSTPDMLYSDVENGRCEQKLMAYTLVAIGRIISKRVKAILVSAHIDQEETRRLGFYYAKNLQAAVGLAFDLTNKDAKVIVLKKAGEILPILPDHYTD
ncbi:MAG: nickel-dependent lactate racemase [Rectinema sp.]